MGKRHKYIVSDRLADVQEEICENLYQESIQKVHDYCGKVNMPNSQCNPCEAETPTIVRRDSDTCAVCGSKKEIQEEYPIQVKQYDEDGGFDYNREEDITYTDNDGDYIGLSHKGKFKGDFKVWKDSEMDDREYVIINYTVVYLDTLTKKEN